MKAMLIYSAFKLKSNVLKKNDRSFNQKSIKIDWIYKRIILHIIRGVLNILGLAYVSTLIIGSSWEFLLLIFGLIYCSSYWLITSILLDLIIGDEIDNSLNHF